MLVNNFFWIFFTFIFILTHSVKTNLYIKSHHHQWQHEQLCIWNIENYSAILEISQNKLCRGEFNRCKFYLNKDTLLHICYWQLFQAFSRWNLLLQIFTTLFYTQALILLGVCIQSFQYTPKQLAHHKQHQMVVSFITNAKKAIILIMAFKMVQLNIKYDVIMGDGNQGTSTSVLVCMYLYLGHIYLQMNFRQPVANFFVFYRC